MSLGTRTVGNRLTAILCSVLLLPVSITPVFAEPQNAPTEANTNIPGDQLDSLVAPIALYPDPLLAQVLAASTYPLELMELRQWLERNQGLKDKALVDAVEKQDWDPSVQAMAPLPDVVKRLTDDVKWTTDLGNAFLAQQPDVMNAVQRMREKAKGNGNLKSSAQQTVETKVVDNKNVIVVEQADPQVIYVPSYNPTVVYGAPAYPYPPIYYPPPGYYAAGIAISFGVGLAMGAAWGGGWGWGCGWGGNNNITINNNNNFINNSNRQNFNSNRQNINNRGNNNWQHNPKHRGGAPYSNRATADRFGGNTRRDSRQNGTQGRGRQASAPGNQNQRGGRQQAEGGNRRGNGGGNAAGNRTNGAGGDRIGNRNVPNTGGGSRGGAFGGTASGSDGRKARTSSSRGQSSMGRARGGGARGGGGRRRR